MLLDGSSSTRLQFYVCFTAPASGVFGETALQEIYSLFAAVNQLISVDRDARDQEMSDDNTPSQKYRHSGIPRFPTAEHARQEQVMDQEKMLKCLRPKYRMMEYQPFGIVVNVYMRRYFEARQATRVDCLLTVQTIQIT